MTDPNNTLTLYQPGSVALTRQNIADLSGDEARRLILAIYENDQYENDQRNQTGGEGDFQSNKHLDALLKPEGVSPEQRRKLARILEDYASSLDLSATRDERTASTSNATSLIKSSNSSTNVPELYREFDSRALRLKLEWMRELSHKVIEQLEDVGLIVKGKITSKDGTKYEVLNFESIVDAIMADPQLQQTIDKLIVNPNTQTPIFFPDFLLAGNTRVHGALSQYSQFPLSEDMLISMVWDRIGINTYERNSICYIDQRFIEPSRFTADAMRFTQQGKVPWIFIDGVPNNLINLCNPFELLTICSKNQGTTPIDTVNQRIAWHLSTPENQQRLFSDALTFGGTTQLNTFDARVVDFSYSRVAKNIEKGTLYAWAANPTEIHLQYHPSEKTACAYTSHMEGEKVTSPFSSDINKHRKDYINLQRQMRIFANN